MKIIQGGLDDPRVQALLVHHFHTARGQTGPESAHALDLGGLNAPEIQFWSAWEGDCVIAVGALKHLSESHGEVTSMHTDLSHRRKGAGSAVLRHIIEAGPQMGLSRLSLETGAWPYFHAAREFYKRHGFVDCPPFGNYISDPNSVFMTLKLFLSLKFLRRFAHLQVVNALIPLTGPVADFANGQHHRNFHQHTHHGGQGRAGICSKKGDGHGHSQLKEVAGAN